jgi:hypothetical protein
MAAILDGSWLSSLRPQPARGGYRTELATGSQPELWEALLAEAPS